MNKHIANITDKELRESFLAVNKQMAESDARLEKQIAETRVLIAENSKENG